MPTLNSEDVTALHECYTFSFDDGKDRTSVVMNFTDGSKDCKFKEKPDQSQEDVRGMAIRMMRILCEIMKTFGAHLHTSGLNLHAVLLRRRRGAFFKV